MPTKLISYMLGGALAFSFIPELKASNQEEEKPKQSGRCVKVATGCREPHPSLMIGVTVEAPDEESPKTRQRKKVSKKGESNSQTQLPNFDTFQTKTLLEALDNIRTESPVPQVSSAKKTERGLRSPAPKKWPQKNLLHPLVMQHRQVISLLKESFPPPLHAFLSLLMFL